VQNTNSYKISKQYYIIEIFMTN